MSRVFKTIIVCILLVFSFLFFPQLASAEETGFRFPTTCSTNGSSCENMRYQDDNYNSWVGTLYREVLSTFTDFGIPEDSVIDDIQVKIRTRAFGGDYVFGLGSWTARWSEDSGKIWRSFKNISYPDPASCLYLLTTNFNSIAYPTFICLNTNDSLYKITGKSINTPSLVVIVWTNANFPEDTDIDTLLFNVRYHCCSVEPTPTPTPTPTVTPTPTPIPGPAPFLDLPWDYEGKGLSFNEAALSINSYFDHEYPLLGSGLGEPTGAKNSVIYFRGGSRDFDRDYSSHDGYDYGVRAKVNVGDPILAASSGVATYVNSCSACGNMILIDHGNGYQTRYLHLQKDGLITSTPGEKISVNARQQIGLVGATGNVSPSGDQGSHIHFGVFEDKNKDGSFDDNVPDGATDPFGWQSKEPDPWSTFSFFYAGLQRTGNKSYYLWKKKIDKLDATLTSNGGVFNNGRYTVDFPKDATDKNLTLNILSEPIVKVSKEIQSIGSTITVIAKDAFGNLVTTFKNLFTITVDFNSFDLTRYDTDTLSIYSSNDGINWIKESTLIDLLNKKATAKVDHLTHFALLAERKDTIPPTTTATLSGDQGQPNWFRSDVTVNLNTEDNENGLGVDYTLYKIEDSENATDWAEYTTPLTFVQEGHHTIEFYSVDKDENVESVKSIEFDIDKTLPEVNVDANPKTIWPPNGKMVNITINGFVTDNHLYAKTITVDDEYNLIEPTISDFGQTIQLEARREGSDKDGRKYIIKVVGEDMAGNRKEAQTQVIVPHDQRDKK